MTLTHRIALPADPASVWAVLERIEDWPAWAPAIRGARRLGPGDLAIGARYALRQPMQPETVWRVTALEPGRSFEWRTERAAGFEAGHAVLPAPDGCRVRAWLRPTGAMRLLWPLLRPVLRRALAAEAAGLAGALRGGAP